MCNNPKPQYGGKQCVGESYEHRACNTRSCPQQPKPNRPKYSWIVRSRWSQCIDGIQHQIADCVNVYDRQLVQHDLCSMPKPDHKRSCNRPNEQKLVLIHS